MLPPINLTGFFESAYIFVLFFRYNDEMTACNIVTRLYQCTNLVIILQQFYTHLADSHFIKSLEQFCNNLVKILWQSFHHCTFIFRLWQYCSSHKSRSCFLYTLCNSRDSIYTFGNCGCGPNICHIIIQFLEKN